MKGTTRIAGLLAVSWTLAIGCAGTAKNAAHGGASAASQSATAAPTPKVDMIAKETLQEWMKQAGNLIVVNVLQPSSYQAGHIPGSINIPLQEIEKRAGELNKDARIVTYCASYQCHASTAAAEKLMALGFTDVHDYKGGIQEWKEAGLPVEASK